MRWLRWRLWLVSADVDVDGMLEEQLPFPTKFSELVCCITDILCTCIVALLVPSIVQWFSYIRYGNTVLPYRFLSSSCVML